MIPLMLMGGVAWYFLGGKRLRFGPLPGRAAPAVVTHTVVNRKLRRRAAKLAAKGQAGNALLIELGPLTPCLENLRGLMIFGLSSGGKSCLMAMYTKSVARLFRMYRGRTRIVILDCKCEMPSKIHRLLRDHRTIPIHLMNPADERFAALRWATMFPGRDDATALAHLLCPSLPNDASPFFRETARHLIRAVIRVFQLHRARAGREWDLYDLLAVCMYRDRLRRVLRKDPEAYGVYKATLHHKTKSGGDVFSTLSGAAAEFADVALAGRRSKNTFDLKEFLQDDGVVILSLPAKNAHSILPLYTLLIKRLVDEARSQVQHPENRLVVCLDELSFVGKDAIDAILEASAIGRSQGVIVAAASQSSELLEDRLGSTKWKALFSTLGTTVGFRVASRATAELIAGRFGSAEELIPLVSHTSGGQGGNTRTVSQHFVTRSTLLPEHLLHNPLADPVEDEMSFYATGPGIGNVFVEGSFLKEASLPDDPDFPNFKQATETIGNMSIIPLSPVDMQALGLT